VGGSKANSFGGKYEPKLDEGVGGGGTGQSKEKSVVWIFSVQHYYNYWYQKRVSVWFCSKVPLVNFSK